MMSSNNNRRIIGAIVILLLLAALVAGAYLVKLQENKARTQAEADSQEINQYLERVYEIDSEIGDLRNEKSSRVEHNGTVNMMFDAPYSEIDLEVYDTLFNAGYKPIINISSDYFPGDTDMLSVQRVQELCNAGSSISITAASTEELSALYERVTALGLPEPQAVFIEAGSDPDIEKAAAELGIHTAICNRTITSIENTESILEMSGTEYYANDRSTFRKNATDSHNCCIYTIGFRGGDGQYHSDTFNTLIDFLGDYLDNESIAIRTPDEAYDYYSKVMVSDDDIDKKIEDLEAEKAELFEKMK